MRHNYKGFRRCDSCCDIEVDRRSDGKYVFIATEARESRHFDYKRFVVREPERQRGSFEIPPVVSGMRLMEPHNANVRSCWRDRSSMLVADSSQRATTIVNAGNGLSANGPMYKVN